MIPNFVTIGHITQDLLPNGQSTPGGTVSFAAVTARNLGCQTAIITVCPAFLRQLPIYQNIQIVGRESKKATIFENVYRPEGRQQFVRAIAPTIQIQDVPPEWAGAGKGIEIVHLGPVAQECGPELLRLFPDAVIGLTPQGFMREWPGDSGEVRPILWKGPGAEAFLSRVGALVLSEEDLPGGSEGEEILREYVACCPVVVLTRGARGCTVYQKGKAQEVAGFKAQEIDPTGAGDVFAAAFFVRLRATNHPIEAARFANAAAACNIEGPGIAGVPVLEQVYQKMQQI